MADADRLSGEEGRVARPAIETVMTLNRDLPRLVCVTGPDGSGKSTQISALKSHLERRGFRAAEVTVWDLLADPSARSVVPFRSKPEVDAYLRILHPVPRSHFLFHCFSQALESAMRRGADVLLLNAYWYKYYAAEVAHGGRAETILRAASTFPEPSFTFHLRIDPATAFRRKKRISGYESGWADPCTPEAFCGFQSRAHRALEDLSAGRNWIALEGTLPAETVTFEILDRLEPELAPC